MEAKISVLGMTCMHCHERVTKAISSLKGVESVDVSLEENNATVSLGSEKSPLMRSGRLLQVLGMRL